MAKRSHVSSETVYFTEVGAAQFERVRDHFGRSRPASDVLRQLVEDKFTAIEGGETRRDQIKGMREDLDAIRVEFGQRMLAMEQHIAALTAAVARLEARQQ